MIEGIDLVGTGPAGPDPCDPIVLDRRRELATQGTWTDNNPLAERSRRPTPTPAIRTPPRPRPTPSGTADRHADHGESAAAVPAAHRRHRRARRRSPSTTASRCARSRTRSFATFEVATDGAGNITRWQITLRESPYTPGNPQHSIDSAGQPTLPRGHRPGRHRAGERQPLRPGRARRGGIHGLAGNLDGHAIRRPRSRPTYTLHRRSVHHARPALRARRPRHRHHHHRQPAAAPSCRSPTSRPR